MPKLNKNTILPVIIIAAVIILYSSITAHAQQKPQFVIPTWGTLLYVPGSPVWNPYAPGNDIWWPTSAPPLAFWSVFTGQPLPILAKNWTVEVLPNGSGILTIYLRHDIYWFNGSATMPFTAWDVYAYFYIGMKAFGWYVPFINQSLVDEDVRVLNNYTIQFLFQKWAPYIPYWILTSNTPTPYSVWKPIVDALKTMNVTQAIEFGSTNITKFVPPYWGLGPYYMTSIGSNFVAYTLEPLYFNGIPLLATWLKILPWESWTYYDPTIINKFIPGGTASILTMIEAHQNMGYISVGWTAQQLKIINSTPGYAVLWYPGFWSFGIALNPYVYPFNLPQVRQAFCYAVNRTEVSLSWISSPAPYPAPVTPNVAFTFPASVLKYYIPCTYNLTYASDLLKSAGLTYKNGQWYLPNGTSLTILISGPSGWTYFMTQGEVVAEEWSAFGVPTKELSLDLSTYFGTIWPHLEWEAAEIQAPEFLVHSYESAWTYLSSQSWITTFINISKPWPFAWPTTSNGKITGWYCSPVTVTVPSMYNSTPPYLNGTIVTCVNSTFGYINLTNWFNTYDVSTPGSNLYEYLTEVLFAWYDYYVPVIPIVYYPYIKVYQPSYMDPLWLYKCALPYASIMFYNILDAHENGGQWNVWAGSPREWLDLGAIAPPPNVPPLAQLIANGSLWTKYPQFAAYLGIPNPDPSLQQCVASYFHIPYTPVSTTTPVTTTSTTTSTVTTTAVSTVTSTVTTTAVSTVTSTATTTAVSTVTVTKPVISTALIAGIVIIVIVIAIVAAIITLRRR
ncbi:ABC transporter substrate-binding protein [Caldivirga maquilingensis]|uniref:Extracellular solute-binding protein family 5 n=1 Tax=Caldivirga maquilingensis (strain ATCC 700844 / DSM 13496 / JCM 10307 / IC-167) TaxID=397948 RepID=A8MAP4_CALMQ|nr:ABC transporter substrate-binding protein [Caldivirga maquilingensis]ABW01080.1 extracellular solute-binding protein family 5 [Caldivirga maquilingensis IC-167]